VLALKPDRIDRSAQLIIIESLKKRRRGVFRAVPLPISLLDALAANHDLYSNDRLWPWCRTTAWSRVKGVLEASGAPVPVRMPKALRHGFGIAGVRRGVPLNMVQKWLGHANLSTTAIYADAIGEEELALASRMWEPEQAPWKSRLD
jgi:integrase/recombinase XerD